MRALDHPKVLRAAGWPLLVAQRLHAVPRRFQSSLPGLSPARLRARVDLPVGGTPDVWLFTGCVMDAWMTDVHRAAATVLRATGATVARPIPGAACCGALHEHAGLASDRAPTRRAGDGHDAGRRADRRRLRRLWRRDEGVRRAARHTGAPRVLGPGARHRRARRGTRCAADSAHRASAWSSRIRATCGMCSAATPPVRTLLGAAYDLAETDDDGLCCGAGGAYAVLEPALALEIRARKVDGAAPGRRRLHGRREREPRVHDASHRRRADRRPPDRALAAALERGDPIAVTAHYDTLIERLQSIEEDLGDLAYARLRELASDPDGDGAARAKTEERKLLAARRRDREVDRVAAFAQ